MDQECPSDHSFNSPSLSCDSTRSCRVCSDSSDGTHFGVDSCRACAAFFRRSIVMKKKYVCRQGLQKCEIIKAVSGMCKKCRLTKCFHSGMDSKGVDKRRLFHASSIECGRRIETIPFLLDNPMEAYPIITLMTKNYTILTEKRKEAENVLSSSMAPPSTIFIGPNGELRPCTSTMLESAMKAAVPLIADFLTSSFPRFNPFNEDEKWSLFRGFIGSFYRLECCYRTSRFMPKDLQRWHITVTTFLDLTRAEEFFCNVQDTNIMDIIRYMCEGAKTELALRVQKSMGRLNLNDEEIVAAIALCLWTPNIDLIPEQVLDICAVSREEIFRDLHNYYRLNKIPDLAARFGEFMTLIADIQMLTVKMRDEMTIYKLLGKEDNTSPSFLYTLLKPS